MTRTIPVNGQALRERLLTAGITDRTYVDRSGIGYSSARSMLIKNEISGAVSIADFRRAALEAGMKVGDLLDLTPQPVPDETPAEDIAVLAQVLTTQTQVHPEDRLAQALGWHLDRLRAAIVGLNASLDAVGLRVHHNTMGVSIRASDNRSSEALKRLTAYRDADDGLDIGTARVMYAAYKGALSPKNLAKQQLPRLGALMKRGVITVGSGVGDRIRLADDTTYAFDVSR